MMTWWRGLALSHIYPHCKTVNMFGFTNRKNSDIQGGWTGGSRLWRAFNCGQKSNIRCFVAKSVMSRVTRAMRGDSQKWWRGGGVTIPPQNDDVIYEQPLTVWQQTPIPSFHKKVPLPLFFSQRCLQEHGRREQPLKFLVESGKKCIAAGGAGAGAGGGSVCLVALECTLTGWFFHWYPPKKLKYGKPRLGESTLT